MLRPPMGGVGILLTGTVVDDRFPWAVRQGSRDTATKLVYHPRVVAINARLRQAPGAPEPADTGEPRAEESCENVQALGELSVGRFGRPMQSMTGWIAPEVENPEPDAPQRGCNHETAAIPPSRRSGPTG